MKAEADSLSRPKSTGILTVLRCISCPDLVILAYNGDKLSCGQAQNEVKFDFDVKFDLEVQGRSSPKIIGISTKVFCTYVSNVVILAWTADELSCGQASDWYTHRHAHTDRYTDRGDDNTRRPKLASGNKFMFFYRKHLLASTPRILQSQRAASIIFPV